MFLAMCKDHNWPSLRLDGTTNSSKRTKLVAEFNDLKNNSFAFLLSSKAGGCGINLIGGNRLVLFDPDWNPARCGIRCSLLSSPQVISKPLAEYGERDSKSGALSTDLWALVRLKKR